jgi:arylsulfatase A-like enzyme
MSMKKALLSLCAGGFISSSLVAAPKPNILLIVADDLGAGDVSAYGNKEFATPHLDALAASGLRFTAGYVTTPLCGPSRAGLLTGRHPCRFLTYEGNPPPGSALGLPAEEKTIADRLKGAGYRTAALGKWHLGEQEQLHPLSRGFDEFYGFLSGMHSYTKTDDPHWGPIVRGRQREELKQYLTFALADEACAFIGRQKEPPYFLYLAFNAPHTPMEAPDEYLAKTAHLADPLRRVNAAMVLALDDAVGRVLDAVRKSGQEENTLIVFLSDNGAPLLKGAAINGGSNAPLRGGKTQLWEGGIRVPFAAAWKGKIAAGGVSAEPVSSLDILPTALAAAGVPADAAWKLEGLNLLPWLTGQAAAAPARGPLFWRFGVRGSQFAVRDGDLKRVKVGKEGGLYDVRQDIGEKSDLLSARGQQAQALEQAWQAWDKGNVAVRQVQDKSH